MRCLHVVGQAVVRGAHVGPQRVATDVGTSTARKSEPSDGVDSASVTSLCQTFS